MSKPDDVAVVVTDLTKDYIVPVGVPGTGSHRRSVFLPGRRRRTLRALDNVSFQIARGEFVAFLGPNGAGKTTTVKILSGILTPTSGQVSVLGMDPRLNHYDFTYLIGVVMGQKSSLVWDVPVRESLRLFADIYELSRPEFDARVEELDPVLGLNVIMAQPVRKLSLGQRMRAEIAASLLHRPRVIFLDEPTIGLDVVTQERVREFLRRANREEDVTILLTTHNLSDVEELCTRAILIDRGRVVYDGTLDYLRKLDPYRTLEVEFAGPTSPALIRHLEEAGAPPEVDAIGSGRLRITLEAEKLPAIVSHCLEELRVSDISVKGPSLSSVLRRVYEGDVSLAVTGQVEPITGPGVDDEGAGL